MAGISNSFQINEKVGFLYETGGGIVRKIDSKGIFYVEDESGFERPFSSNELVRIHGEHYTFSDEIFSELKEDDLLSERNYSVKEELLTGQRKPIEVWEIDLHIESLLESHVGMTNQAILNYQMKKFRIFFKHAKEHHIRKLIAIHGVGEGILKEEVRAFLANKQGVVYYDADFREYGKGATAIEIRYNLV